MVAGYAIGGGHVLHLVCDITIAADNAVFGQTGPKVGSFDAGYGATLMARIVGHKKAREIWFCCWQYSAQEALDMGLVNKVVPLASLEDETVRWGRRMLELRPTALRCPQAAFAAAPAGPPRPSPLGAGAGGRGRGGGRRPERGPTAVALLKAAVAADTEGLAGLQPRA